MLFCVQRAFGQAAFIESTSAITSCSTASAGSATCFPARGDFGLSHLIWFGCPDRAPTARIRRPLGKCFQWELRDIRSTMRGRCSLAKERPVFTGLPKEEAFKIFHRVNELLGNSGAPSDAALNCCVTELLGYMAENREAERLRSGRDIQNDGPEVSRALQQMAANIERPWRASQLARLSGLSERHFFAGLKRRPACRRSTGLDAEDKLGPGANC